MIASSLLLFGSIFAAGMNFHYFLATRRAKGAWFAAIWMVTAIYLYTILIFRAGLVTV